MSHGLPVAVVGKRVRPIGSPRCHTCDDAGYVRRRPGQAGEVWLVDACPDCTREAEAQWQAATRGDGSRRLPAQLLAREGHAA